MKKLTYITSLIILTTLGSCTKELDQLPVSSTSTENFFSNTNDFQLAVNGVYSKLKSYATQAMWMNEMRSDNVSPVSDGNRDWQGINDFSPNITTTAFIAGAWNNDFNGIYNANVVLDKLSTNGSVITDATLRKRFEAEVRFLRAFYYLDLVRLYGKAPVIDKPLMADQVASIPRSSVADVYSFIIKDLEYAIANLPASYTGVDIGRATSGAAKGILGLVYLTKSGPTYSVDGPGLNSNEYGKALSLFNEIIASNQYQFLAKYTDIFSYTNENNKEVLFDIQFMTTNNGAEFPSQLVPDTYWAGLGLSNYGNGYGSASYNVTKDLMQSYRTSAGTGKVDIRDTFSIQHSFALSTAANAQIDTTRPFIKKYINIAKKGTKRDDWPINFIALRYTDILMMKAECMLHGAGGTQADVDAIVNQVRARAGLSSVSNVDLPALMEERRREFIGEGLRWNDLVREGMAVTTMNNWINSDKMTTINKVIPQYVIYPIPQVEIQTKPGLYTQNEGYN
ncbi:RagB/SusD family nutrient uptake outer membrane protein [Chitinophagaceae bacterium LB-8]|uniref:RagB/SusD family nutrient uptake outer membrane protein n=1 Tax=Paraflavisolibacter caeni TaxID=2982496 RepID=A0A9X2XP78_9BACT|nr:RagB/SusD family nutrient uptake outer membrane protein [Paraflavisolibacter caeni]MCU7550633.1 RagB/SusD family nutrient uptake outer membrane protein [Paraflavisolibacter caeni]